MTKKRVLKRIREKLTKVSVYHAEALRTYGKAISDEMFNEDLDFLSSLLYFMDKAEEFN